MLKIAEKLSKFILTQFNNVQTFGFIPIIHTIYERTRTAVISAFLKKNTSIYDIKITGRKTLKIKFEVDTQSPLLFNTEKKLLLQPFSFYVKCFTIENLYLGKMHALLFRQWKNRIKGRDWIKSDLSQQDFLTLLRKKN